MLEINYETGAVIDKNTIISLCYLEGQVEILVPVSTVLIFP